MNKKKTRKVRSNRKYKYTKKRGKMQPYYSKRDRNDPLKVWFWRAEPMSYSSIRRIPKKLRPTARKIIYVKDIKTEANPKELSTKKKVEEFALACLNKEGDYYMMMFCKRKNQWGVSPVKTAEIVIKETTFGLKAEMIKNFRLYRYWFWKKRK